MRAPEWIALAYLAYLLLLAWIRPLPMGRRLAITSASAAAMVLLAAVPLVPPDWRRWLPLASVYAGYKVSGLFFVHPMPAFEGVLASWDRRLFAAWRLDERIDRAPRLLLECVEAAYFATPGLLALGACVLLARGRPNLLERYWTLVLLAEFGAFGALPWIQTRAPWQVEPSASMDDRGLAARWLNHRVNRPTTIRVNTFPSGHASGALAAAIGVMAVAPAAGVIFLLCALTVMVGSVLGRYHYALDVVAGSVVAIVAAAVVGLIAR